MLDDAIESGRYENWLRAAGWRPDTVARALELARRYIAACRAGGKDTIAIESVSDFLAHTSRRVKRVSQLNYYKELQTLFKYAIAHGITAENPLDSIPRPRPTQHELEKDTRFLPYSVKEFKQLVQATPSWTWVGLRDRALLAVFWETPLRVSEVIGLQVSDIDWEQNELLVRDGKGGARYEALISLDCAAALRVYIEDREPREDLFLSARGESLTRHAVEQLLHRLAKRARWEKPCAPHLFRHNWRLRMRTLGLDDAAISAMMGHTTVVITHSYARESARRLAKDQLRRLREPNSPQGRRRSLSERPGRGRARILRLRRAG